MTKPSVKPQEQVRQAVATDKSEGSALGSSPHLEQARGTGSSAEGDVEVLMTEVLSELDFLNHQEKKIKPGVAPPAALRTLEEAVSAPMKSIGNKLLGILGHCALPGHIAHFYNLQFQIERHIKSVSEFQDPRFVKAYDYLKANPSTEAVFVYESKMIAANRRDGRLIHTAIERS